MDIQPLLYALKRKISEHRKMNKIRFGVSPFLATYYLPELEGPNIKVDLTVTKEECFEFIQMLESGEKLIRLSCNIIQFIKACFLNFFMKKNFN
ncbi:type 2 periplasmic-binding domain-containing protein [Bacillus spizizenii]|uniref:hypothetical protein n=1 Tax=Bacillus spizizenii TaxID=96241 RepID=UPI001F61FAEC|nr:hypothetical protein [Bacillus spizizenii]MCI4168283.1 hypothetical protein [Bacillus spizizenii]